MHLWGIAIIIYYTESNCYQCCFILECGIYSPPSIFYSPDGAEEFARSVAENFIF